MRFLKIFPAAFSVMIWMSGVLPAQAEEKEEQSDFQLAAPFADHAVLQQGVKLPVWGQALPGAKVTVRFSGQSKTTDAAAGGAWKVTLDPMGAVKLKSVNDCPQGQTMTLVCEKDGKTVVRKVENLIMGDVWLCAGQSNMAGKMRTKKSRHFPEDSIEKANYPALRQMVSGDPEGWRVCSPETAPDFKKVAFFFGRRVQQDALVPVGLVVAAVGGSNIESWLNQKPYPSGRNYSGLLEPFVGYGLRGAIWYQGESNANDGRDYQPKLESLITGWRKVWGMGDFPVYFVQLPGIGNSVKDNAAQGDGRAEIRQAYFETLALKNTGMAVTIDIGDEREHPPNKYDTGVRLAHLALRNDYGLKDLAVSPLYQKHRIEGRTIRVSFEGADKGLMLAQKEGFLPPKAALDGKPGWLSIQAKDGVWHWADGVIVGSELVVSSKEVKTPIAVRYAYTNRPEGPLLYSRAGLPVGPFSTIGYGPTYPEAGKGKRKR